MSKGPGIQPIKAIRKTHSEEVTGNTCVIVRLGLVPRANTTAISVLTLSESTIIFMLLSNQLYFPRHNTAKHNSATTTDSIGDDSMPKSRAAIPAVTAVTAA